MQQGVAAEVLRRAQGTVTIDEFGRADRKHILLEEERGGKARKIARAPADERIGGVRIERVVVGIGVQQHVDLGMTRLEPPDAADEPSRGERRARVDDQNTAPLGLAHRARGARQDRESLGETRGPRRAGLGQRKPAAGALDQRRADLLLEQPDLLRDRRLGHVQFLRRAGEGQPARNSFEGAQRVQRRQSVGRSHSMGSLSFIGINIDLLQPRMPLYRDQNKRNSAPE